ncbi:MAG: GNAT family N-acetyltransferase [Candidatus Paceibacterota bacterium]|nr:GNAT family N-acetyltransferase [Candidatus Nomurabacteria bacterium]
MNPEDQKLNITPKPEKVIREKIQKTEDLSLKFSSEMDNDNKNISGANKKIEVSDDKDNSFIGNVYFYESDNSLEIKLVSIEPQYRGQNIGISLYKELIRIAKDKGKEKVCSDSTVQAGALSAWKKLKDEGFSVKINPSIEEKFNEFQKTYNEGKYFKEFIKVPEGEHAFEVVLDNKS